MSVDEALHFIISMGSWPHPEMPDGESLRRRSEIDGSDLARVRSPQG